MYVLHISTQDTHIFSFKVRPWHSHKCVVSMEEYVTSEMAATVQDRCPKKKGFLGPP